VSDYHFGGADAPRGYAQRNGSLRLLSSGSRFPTLNLQGRFVPETEHVETCGLHHEHPNKQWTSLLNGKDEPHNLSGTLEWRGFSREVSEESS
jgi:hypothetical protein